jgi:hypothetical protein
MINSQLQKEQPSSRWDFLMFNRSIKWMVLLTVLLLTLQSLSQEGPKPKIEKSVPGAMAAKENPGAADSIKAGTAKPDEAKANNASASPLQKARLNSIDLDHSTVTITMCHDKCEGSERKLTIQTGLLPTLQTFKEGDLISISVDAQSIVQNINLAGRPIGIRDRVKVLATTVASCFFLVAVLTWWRPLQLITGQDGRYSNSKLQMALWFFVVIATYLATVYLRISRIGWDLFGGVNIPDNLLLLSGISALTFGGAKGITTGKVDAAAAQGMANPKPPGQPHFWRDLIQNDVGSFDLGDFQMLMVTLLAVGMYLAATLHFLGLLAASETVKLPDIDTTVLATFGLGQGAYLTKKALGNAGTS